MVKKPKAFAKPTLKFLRNARLKKKKNKKNYNLMWHNIIEN
jgi:hypothetical protein